MERDRPIASARIPSLEGSGPHDHIGHEALSSHWSHLTDAEQTLLNELADAKDAEFEAWWREFQLVR